MSSWIPRQDTSQSPPSPGFALCSLLCKLAIIPGGLTRFVQLIDVLLAQFSREDYFETHYKP